MLHGRLYACFAQWREEYARDKDVVKPWKARPGMQVGARRGGCAGPAAGGPGRALRGVVMMAVRCHFFFSCHWVGRLFSSSYPIRKGRLRRTARPWAARRSAARARLRGRGP